MKAKLKKTGRFAWVAEEVAALQDPHSTSSIPIWRGSGSSRAPATSESWLCWRRWPPGASARPRRATFPAAGVLKDEALTEIAAHPPETPEALERIRAVPRLCRLPSWARSLMEAITLGMSAAKPFGAARMPFALPAFPADERRSRWSRPAAKMSRRRPSRARRRPTAGIACCWCAACDQRRPSASAPRRKASSSAFIGIGGAGPGAFRAAPGERTTTRRRSSRCRRCCAQQGHLRRQVRRRRRSRSRRRRAAEGLDICAIITLTSRNLRRVRKGFGVLQGVASTSSWSGAALGWRIRCPKPERATTVRRRAAGARVLDVPVRDLL